MKKIFKIVAIIAVFAMVMVGCKKVEMTYKMNNQTTESLNIDNGDLFTVQSGMLVFKTEKDFITSLQMVSQMNYDDYLNWCKIHNFVSLYKIYNDALNSEADYNEYCDKMQAQDAKFVRNEHSVLLQNNIESGLIKFSKSGDGKQNFELNTCRNEYSLLLNVDKMVSINGDIYQYDEADKIKIIKNNNFSKITGIEAITETTSDGSVTIWNDQAKSIEDFCWYYLESGIYYSPDDKRHLTIGMVSYNRQATSTGPYYLCVYADMYHYKNDNINKPNSIKILKNTTFKIEESTTQNPLSILIEYNFQRDQVFSKQSFVRYFFVNGAYPRTLTSDIIHFPHIHSSSLDNSLRFYVDDIYWTPFQGNQLVIGEKQFAILPVSSYNPNGYLVR